MTAVPLDRTARRAEVLWRRSGQSVLARRPGEEELVVVAGTGLALWDRLDEPISVRDLAADLAATFSADLGTVETDVVEAVAELAGRGLVVVE